MPVDSVEALPDEGGGRSLVFELPQSDEEEEEDEGDTNTRATRHPPPPATDKLLAPRLEGSLDRLGEHKQRAAHPRAKSYDPAETMGAGTCKAFAFSSPSFSMGGGPTRMPFFDKKKEHLAHITNTSSKKGANKPNALTLMDIKEAIKPRRKRQASLSRGFGSEARLSVKGGPLDLPVAPGPGTYEVARAGDPEPVWLSTGTGPHCLWGKRTEARPEMRSSTSNPANIGPGDHIADHPFKAAGPSPLFGHPLNEISRPDWPGLEPTRYDLRPHLSRVQQGAAPTRDDDRRAPSNLSLDRSPIYSVGPGQRQDTSKLLQGSPGPAHYSPLADAELNRGATISFGKSVRQHQCELIDPDEPPGPGSHEVKEKPKPSNNKHAKEGNLWLPGEAKLRKVSGLGPEGPGPGDAYSGIPTTLEERAFASRHESHGRAKGSTCGIPLARPALEGPGPGQYQPDDSLTIHGSPSWGSIGHRSSVRKPPWREVHQPPVFTLSSGKQLVIGNVPIKFKPTGPKWSMMPRRADQRYLGEGHGEPGNGEAMAVTSCFDDLRMEPETKQSGYGTLYGTL